MERKKIYDAILFRQRPNSPLQVAFAAPSSEVDSWARVPTKRTGDVRNFQRAEIGKHLKEVGEFFKDSSNSSPTAIVVGFDPVRAKGRVRTYVNDSDVQEPQVTPGTPVQGKLELSWEEDPDPQTRDALVSAIVSNAPKLKEFIYAELKDIAGLSPGTLDKVADAAKAAVTQGLKPEIVDTEESLEEMGGAEAEDEEASDEMRVLPEVAVPDSIRQMLPGLSPSEQQVVAGRLFFWAQLTAELLKDKPVELLKSLHEEVHDELKPGILIDGQHRVVGTKKLGDIPFLVTALPTAAWPELAFQFIVTNRTAKKVPESLLISIVGNSLSKVQRAEIEERLHGAGIRVGLIEAVMRVHEDPSSPFHGWLAFGLQGEKGFLDAAAMRSKVIQLWYERLPPVTQLFDHLCSSGKGRSERTEYWKAQELWFKMFIAFWDAVRERYRGSSVFSAEMTTNAKTKAKEPASKLMTATVLKIFQATILDHIHENLRDRHNMDGAPIASFLPDESAFSAKVKGILTPLTPEFFQGWDITGFDGSPGARTDLQDAILKVIKMEKNVSALKGGKKPHRLFQGEH